ncbi:hypothetical protein D3C86_2218110 [compost metagenome]
MNAAKKVSIVIVFGDEDNRVLFVDEFLNSFFVNTLAIQKISFCGPTRAGAVSAIS